MKRINWLKNCIQNEGRVLSRDTGSLLAAAWKALGLFAAALLLPQLGLRLGPAWLARLSDLVGTLALTPVFVALALTVLAAAWRRQRCAPAEAVKGLREKLWRVLATGLCVWAGSLALNLPVNLIRWATGLLTTLTGWIPGVGAVVGALSAALVWLTLQTQAFIAHVALVYGLVALVLDGLWALPQAKRALTLLWGGRTDSLPGLALLFILWIAVRALCALLGALMGGAAAALLTALLETCLIALSTAATAAICLRERDRQSGWAV